MPRRIFIFASALLLQSAFISFASATEYFAFRGVPKEIMLTDNGFMISGFTYDANVDQCKYTPVRMPNENVLFNTYFSLVLAAKMSNSEIRVYVNGCDQNYVKISRIQIL